jgi:hypothetical protein
MHRLPSVCVGKPPSFTSVDVGAAATAAVAVAHPVGIRCSAGAAAALFGQLDVDSDGRVSWNELRHALADGHEVPSPAGGGSGAPGSHGLPSTPGSAAQAVVEEAQLEQDNEDGEDAARSLAGEPPPPRVRVVLRARPRRPGSDETARPPAFVVGGASGAGASAVAESIHATLEPNAASRRAAFSGVGSVGADAVLDEWAGNAEVG